MSEKCCTFKVKFSDVQPMDVKFSDVQPMGSKKGTVRYDVAQELTDDEQAQARGNIGAVSVDEVETALDELSDSVNESLEEIADTVEGGFNAAGDAIVSIKTALDDKVDAPQTASVGDVLTVEEVDEDGKPTRWKTSEQVQADWAEVKTNDPSYVVGKTHYTEPEHEVLVIPANASEEIFYPDEKLKTGENLYYLKDPTGKMENSSFFALNALQSDSVYVRGYAKVQRLTIPVRLEITNLAGVELILCQKSYTKKLSPDYLTLPSYSSSTGEYTPGVVKVKPGESSIESQSDRYRIIKSDDDGKIYEEVEVAYFKRFDVDVLNSNIQTISCAIEGSLSSYFPDVPATAYPVLINNFSQLGVYWLSFRFANGDIYSATVATLDDGELGLENVTLKSTNIKKQYESYLVYDKFSSNRGVSTYISLGLVEGEEYTLKCYSGGEGNLVFNTTAVYSEALGMVACFCDGNVDEPIYNRFYVGDTQSYINNQYAGMFGGASIESLYGYKLLPTIPVEMIDGLGNIAPVLKITITSTEDEDGNITYTADKTGEEIMNACQNGVAVVEYEGYVYALDNYWLDSTTTHIYFAYLSEDDKTKYPIELAVNNSTGEVVIEWSEATSFTDVGAVFHISENADGSFRESTSGDITYNSIVNAESLFQVLTKLHGAFALDTSVSLYINVYNEDNNEFAGKVLSYSSFETDWENFVVTFDDTKEGTRYTFTGNFNDVGEDGWLLMLATKTELPSGGSSVEIDTTLTESGKAADAKAVGDRLIASGELTDDSTVDFKNSDGTSLFSVDLSGLSTSGGESGNQWDLLDWEYKLDGEKEFDGATTINTEIALSADTITCMIDFTSSSDADKNAGIMSCITSYSPWTGIALKYLTESSVQVIAHASNASVTLNALDRIRAAVVIDKTIPKTTWYLYDGTNFVKKEFGVKPVSDNAKLILGGRFEDIGYWKGTIHDFRYTPEALSEDDVTALLKGTHTGASYVESPKTGNVGEVLAVAEVDDTGKPTRWETVESYTKAEIDTMFGSYITDVDTLIGGDE